MVTEHLQIAVVHNCARNIPQKSVFLCGGTAPPVAAVGRQWKMANWFDSRGPAPPPGAGQRRIISCSKSDLQFIIFGFKNRSLSHVPRSELVFSHNYQVLRIRYAAFGILGNLSSSHNKVGLKGLDLTKPFTKYLPQNWEVGCNTKTS